MTDQRDEQNKLWAKQIHKAFRIRRTNTIESDIKVLCCHFGIRLELGMSVGGCIMGASRMTDRGSNNHSRNMLESEYVRSKDWKRGLFLNV